MIINYLFSINHPELWFEDSSINIYKIYTKLMKSFQDDKLVQNRSKLHDV